jgi:RsiW-degrading membrane proteinase PrsW (M82 family)
VVLVILIRGFFDINLQEINPEGASDLQYKTLVLMVLITPFAAELIKPIGLFLVRADITEAEDGLIYGAVIGLGYTATENIMFGIFLAPAFGVNMFITVVFMRSMSVMFIQSSTTALTCYGITRAMKVKHKTGRFYAFPLFLFAAIGIHAGFNYLAFSGAIDLLEVGNVLSSMSNSLLFSIIFAFIFMILIYVKIYRLDRLDDKEQLEKSDEDFRRRPRDEYYDESAYAPESSRQFSGPPPHRAPEQDYDPYYDDYDYGPPQREAYPPPRAPAAAAPRPPNRPPTQRSVHAEFSGMYEPPTRGTAPSRVSASAAIPPPPPVPRPPMRGYQQTAPSRPARTQRASEASQTTTQHPQRLKQMRETPAKPKQEKPEPKVPVHLPDRKKEKKQKATEPEPEEDGEELDVDWDM